MAEDALPDPLEPGGEVRQPLRPAADAPRLPRGDLRVASWIALVSGIVVLAWYLSIIVAGGAYLADLSSPAQMTVWGLAVVSFVCGILSLNARRNREFAAVGFISGVVALLVTLSIGLSTGFQIIF